ncbi:MAG: NADP-dependent isocitrate dehydrogenase, partial [Rhodospirillaceae bacterium]|nr:NADP-dependent isocitrate dehydrogenase [Rhodospirillaceae bacterium]
SRGLSHRAKLDENDALARFAETLEKACVDTVEGGEMTKDLALLVPGKPQHLNSKDFLEAIARKLEAAMS